MAGIYWNEEEGIISLSSDGETWLTIADKNLGATQVYNDGDTLSEANSGKYYQWGNNYGFPFTGAVTTSSTQVNAGTYGPGNYYSSSTFITNSSGNRDSSNNGNLWGYTTGTLEAMQGPSAEGYHVPTSIEWENIINLGQTIGAWESNGGGDFSKLLKLPFAGQINIYGNLTSQGTVGFYHSSRYFSGQNVNLQFQTSQLLIVQMDNERGQPIRSFKNTPVVPDYNDTWETLYGDELPDRPVPPEPQLPKLKRIVKHNNYYFFGEKPTHASGITLNKNSITLTTIGQTEQLTATITPEDAVNKKVLWSSSDTTVATVSSTGLVTCVEPGECTITATCADGGASTSCSVSRAVLIDFLLVGGGGGGGGGYSACYSGGGGGAGGVIVCCNAILENNSYCVNIGCPGSGGSVCQYGINGYNSCFNGLVAYGGGGGGSWIGGHACKGLNGGSGGGGPGANDSYGVNTGGTGCSGQGFNGGCGYLVYSATSAAGGGGGGAGTQGGNSSYCNYQGGSGGQGIYNDFSGTCQQYGGGGGGGGYDCRGGSGSYGGGRGGSKNYSPNGANATTYGSGGGGGAEGAYGGRGCQGIFILRYLTDCGYDMTGGCKYTCGDYTIHCFTSDGTLTIN